MTARLCNIQGVHKGASLPVFPDINGGNVVSVTA